MLLQAASGKTPLKIALIFVTAVLLSGTLACLSGPIDTSQSTTPDRTVEPDDSTQPETIGISSGINYVIVDTGQFKCYGTSTEITCQKPGEPFYGQDAQFTGHQPAYKDNGDGTITDLNTGLMWQKTPGDKTTYHEAVTEAPMFDLAGYNDWRLPTIKELYSLIDFSGTDPSGPDEISNPIPFINTGYFDFKYGYTDKGERIIDAQYWSSTEYEGTTMDNAATVFGVNFADGRIKGYPRDRGPGGQPMTEFVRYVRDNENYGVNDFTDNNDGTITDKATGLMWSQTDNGQGMDWEDALDWVQQKNSENYLGYSDWRLPNAKELQSIVDYTRSPSTTDSAAIDPLFDTTSIINERGVNDYPFYWTGTTHVNYRNMGDNAVYIAFGEATGYWLNNWLDVHGAGAQRSDPKSGSTDAYPEGHGPQGDAIRIYNFVRPVRNADL